MTSAPRPLPPPSGPRWGAPHPARLTIGRFLSDPWRVRGSVYRSAGELIQLLQQEGWEITHRPRKEVNP